MGSVGRQVRQARDAVAEEDNRSVFGKLFRGGKTRQAREQLTEVENVFSQISAEVEEARQTVRSLDEVLRTRPVAEDLDQAHRTATRLEQAVTALDDPAGIQAEATWRAEAPAEAVRFDQTRRQTAAQPVARDLIEGTMGQIYDSIRQASTSTQDQESSIYLGHEPHSYSPGLGTERGFDL